jgi:hypothetical protein
LKVLFLKKGKNTMAQSFLINQVADIAARDALTAQNGMQVYVADVALTYIYQGAWVEVLTANVPPTIEGIATLVNGTVTVISANAVINAPIFVSYKSISGVPGSIYSNGADSSTGLSFVINSTSLGDNSDVYYRFIGTN